MAEIIATGWEGHEPDCGVSETQLGTQHINVCI